ncbi:alkylmercury lyase family protein [Rhabdothermincola sediminis]|uniref:alkylmercury lyase family protein n=1 Tax=Rhabdothermincola sediminis TaxID=2751370 RepID=UPI001AA06AC6|nr:alkylmercury lyase family protein [Rhabdothermincola sediminis]
MTDYRSKPVPSELGTRLAELHNLDDPPATLGHLADQLGGLLTRLASTDTVESLLCCGSTSRHQTVIEGQIIHTHCVLDSLMLPAIRNRPAIIHSTSPRDEQPIHVTIDRDTVTADPPTAVMSLGVARYGNGSIYDTACPYINAFTSDGAYQRWADATPGAVTMALSIGDAVTLAADLVAQTRAGHV